MQQGSKQCQIIPGIRVTDTSLHCMPTALAYANDSTSSTLGKVCIQRHKCGDMGISTSYGGRGPRSAAQAADTLQSRPTQHQIPTADSTARL